MAVAPTNGLIPQTAGHWPWHCILSVHDLSEYIMVLAIGIPSIYRPLASGSAITPAAVASLQAQLAQYQRQLSDCVHCDTANTPAGKAQIQEIAGKISALKQSIAQAGDASPFTDALTANGNRSKAPTVSPAANLTIGTLIDIYS